MSDLTPEQRAALTDFVDVERRARSTWPAGAAGTYRDDVERLLASLADARIQRDEERAGLPPPGMVMLPVEEDAKRRRELADARIERSRLRGGLEANELALANLRQGIDATIGERDAVTDVAARLARALEESIECTSGGTLREDVERWQSELADLPDAVTERAKEMAKEESDG